MNPVKLPKMTKKEIADLIKGQMICRIAFKGEKAPYIAPFQYALIDGKLYFHFTKYGRKIDLIKKGEPVCVEIEKTTPDMSEYAFVSLIGNLKIVEDPEERAKAIKKLAEEGKRRLSKNFLAAHGFNAEDGWDSLSPEKPLIIVKLETVTDVVGLKSPKPPNKSKTEN